MKKSPFPAARSVRLIFAVFMIGIVSSSELSGGSVSSGTIRTLAGELRKDRDIELFLLDLMKTSSLTALSVAVVQDDRVVFDRILGVVDRKSRKLAASRTVFRAASHNKPVYS